MSTATPCMPLLDGEFRPSANPIDQYIPLQPANGQSLQQAYPVSGSADLDLALGAAERAAAALAACTGAQIAAFLERYAALIEQTRAALCELAHLETGLPLEPRLHSVELPRTVDQLRQAAACALSGNWTEPVIDTRTNIRRCLGSLGKPVWILGPNNFPLAFNAIAGSDFASALVARCPVIAQAHPGHPGTTALLAQLALSALRQSALPTASVQLLFGLPPALGLRLAGNARLGAVGFTGGRSSGRALKAAADAAGVPIHLELSSINPQFILPGVLRERGLTLAADTFASCTLGSGQFCTNPGVLVMLDDVPGDAFVEALQQRFAASTAMPLLGQSVLDGVRSGIQRCLQSGARMLAQGQPSAEPGLRHPPTLLEASASQWLHAAGLREEVFGPVTLLVRAANAEQLLAVARTLQGELSASVFSASDGGDDALAHTLSTLLRPRVGRLLNDKFPTGVAVSSAMHHGGPWPCAGSGSFSAVGMPDAIRRFATLHCYDNVREERLPAELRKRNPDGHLQRRIDGVWSCADLP